ncbi:porin [bacterium SCSIO 12741]|nr:porin [bacterium SCSIO 12741]
MPSYWVIFVGKALMKNLTTLLLLGLALPLFSVAQTDSTQKSTGKFDYTFYIDAYYSYDFNRPYDHERSEFIYQYNQHNQFSINMAVANVNYKNGNLTANLGLNAGDFPQRNMGNERDLIRYLYQANISYKFFKKWEFTVGMFPSHLGFESALSYDNFVVSHSLASEWTPYYLAGAKIAFTPSKKWAFSFTGANAGQRVGSVPGINNKLLGLQATWTPNDKVLINYSNAYFSEQPDSLKRSIFYNNLYATFKLTKKLDLITGIDLGIQEEPNDSTFHTVAVATAIARYQFAKKWAVAGRFEFYNDPDNLVVPAATTGNAFVTSCSSLNLDYQPMDRLKIRLEGRYFSSEKPLFRDDTDFDPNSSTTVRYTNQDLNLLLSIQASF